MTPTARTLAECRKRGWIAQVVEHFNTFTKRRHDLFGVIDVVALTGSGILAIQATSGANHSSRVAKVRAETRALTWVACGGRIEVWSWAKKGPRGKAKRWTLRTEQVTWAEQERAA